MTELRIIGYSILIEAAVQRIAVSKYDREVEAVMVPVEAIANTPMFSGLTDEQLANIAEISHRVTFEAGATAFLEGQRASTLFVIEEGKVALEMRAQLDPNLPPRHTIVDVLSPGDTMAWSALVEPHVLTMSARCVKKTVCIAVDGAGLRQLMAADCSLGFKILQRLAGVMSRRLKDTREQLVGERGLALVYESLRDSC